MYRNADVPQIQQEHRRGARWPIWLAEDHVCILCAAMDHIHCTILPTGLLSHQCRILRTITNTKNAVSCVVCVSKYAFSLFLTPKEVFFTTKLHLQTNIVYTKLNTKLVIGQ